MQWWRDHQYHLLHLSVLTMLWVISVFTLFMCPQESPSAGHKKEAYELSKQEEQPRQQVGSSHLSSACMFWGKLDISLQHGTLFIHSNKSCSVVQMTKMFCLVSLFCLAFFWVELVDSNNDGDACCTADLTDLLIFYPRARWEYTIQRFLTHLMLWMI